MRASNVAESVAKVVAEMAACMKVNLFVQIIFHNFSQQFLRYMGSSDNKYIIVLLNISVLDSIRILC